MCASVLQRISYTSHPHIGTDLLMSIAIKMRKYLIANGAFYFSRLFESFEDGGKNSRYIAKFAGGEKSHDHLVLALGHSARDTYENLYTAGIDIKPKPYAMGLESAPSRRY